MRTIPLTQNKITLVDDEDFKWLNQWKWFAHSPAYNDAAKKYYGEFARINIV
jgi:hypothetical protein